MTLSRRSILYLVSLLVVSVALFRWRTTLKNLLSKPQTVLPVQPKLPNHFTEGDKALVSLVRGDNVGQMVREAIDLIGGIEKLAVRGQTVLLKPNVVSGEPSPATTNPEVIRAAIHLVKQAGARKIYVGDMSALLTLPTRKNMARTGILKVAEETGAEPLFLEDHGWVKIDLPQANYLREAYVSEWIYKADRVINLPVIKTHRSATYSLCLKNFIGATHGRQRPYLIDASHWEEIIAELNLAYQPHLNIVDGTKAMVSGGPWSGAVEKTGIIAASGDRIAADIIGLALIKHFGKARDVAGKNVWEQRQIKRAIELGLGAKGHDSILLKHKSLMPQDADFNQLIASIEKHAATRTKR
ncbi:MAG: DUF362 domain-containing protein [Deltaproteobacteria bacterium]|nr:DUF362 domain-containing protein [Deltaproteobacteria bacterium]